MQNRPSAATGANPNPIHTRMGCSRWDDTGTGGENTTCEQGREGKNIQLAHHQHENHHIGDVDARITEVVPGAHKASADRDGYPHQDEIAEQSH